MEEKILSIHPRRLARQVAKAQLDRSRITGYNKNSAGGSTFSQKWKEIVIAAMKPRNRKGRKKR